MLFSLFCVNFCVKKDKFSSEFSAPFLLDILKKAKDGEERYSNKGNCESMKKRTLNRPLFLLAKK